MERITQQRKFVKVVWVNEVLLNPAEGVDNALRRCCLNRAPSQNKFLACVGKYPNPPFLPRSLVGLKLFRLRTPPDGDILLNGNKGFQGESPLRDPRSPRWECGSWIGQ